MRAVNDDPDSTDRYKKRIRDEYERASLYEEKLRAEARPLGEMIPHYRDEFAEEVSAVQIELVPSTRIGPGHVFGARTPSRMPATRRTFLDAGAATDTALPSSEPPMANS